MTIITDSDLHDSLCQICIESPHSLLSELGYAAKQKIIETTVCISYKRGDLIYQEDVYKRQPPFSSREALTCTSPMVTCPLPHSSAARERVLNIRTAQSHLSILIFSSTISLIKSFPFNFYFLSVLKVFIVLIIPCNTCLLYTSSRNSN